MKKLVIAVLLCVGVSCFAADVSNNILPNAPEPKVDKSATAPVLKSKQEAGDRFFSAGNTVAIAFSATAAGYHAYQSCYAYNEKEKLAQIVPYVHNCTSQIELSSVVFAGGLIMSAVFHNTGHKKLKVFSNVLAGIVEGGAAGYQKFYK